jgi:hypothetical protein
MPAMACSSAPSVSIFSTSGGGIVPAPTSSSIDTTATSISSRTSAWRPVDARCDQLASPTTSRRAAPLRAPTASSRISAWAKALSAMLWATARAHAGTGSKATTRPAGPTSRAPRIVKKPMFAPTS